MAFRFQKASCVILGSFNVHVVQPSWLQKTGIVPDVNGLHLEVSLDFPGHRFTVPNGPVQWTVRPDRLAIESESINVDCGAIAAKVVATLPWTPFVGIGNNLTYESDATEPLGFSFPELPIPADCNNPARRLAISCGEAGSVFNLQVAADSAKKTMFANVHTNLRDRDASFVAATAESFMRHRIRSLELLTQVFGVSLE